METRWTTALVSVALARTTKSVTVRPDFLDDVIKTSKKGGEQSKSEIEFLGVGRQFGFCSFLSNRMLVSCSAGCEKARAYR